MEKAKKKRTIKIIVGILALLLVAIAPVFVWRYGCHGSVDMKVGDFNVRFYWDYCSILGTTEQGENQRFLVVPKEIWGKPVIYLGVENKSIFSSLKITRPEIESDSIERVYFEGKLFAYPASFSECEKLNKVIYVGGEAVFLNSFIGGRRYFPYEVFANAEYNQDLQTWFHSVPANVSYYYNYNSTEKDGYYSKYYWVDDYDYGSKIEYIPKKPIRNGYTFGGWYKEAECINVWNFDTDTLPEVDTTKIDEDNEDAYYYQETILFAKWNR